MFEQHATAYSMLKLRSGLVPIVQVSSNIAQRVIMIGLEWFIVAAGIRLFYRLELFSLLPPPYFPSLRYR